MPQANPQRRHPAVSDIALALAQRRSDPVSKVEISLNAKGDVQIAVDVSDTDPAKAAEAAANLFDVLRAKYPREERPAPKQTDEDARNEADMQALRGRIAAAKGRK